MRHIVATCVLILGCVAAIPALAGGRLAEVRLVDRDTGQQLEAYYRHGEYWVAGEQGAHYAIYIRNRLGERLLAVTSVDGINAITGQSAGWDQAGYVLDPWQACQIAGWRKSDYQIAAFAFTATPRSYAARTGRPENVGVIGIALFREQPSYAALPPVAPPIGPPVESEAPEAAQRSPSAAERAQGEAEASAPVAPESRSSDLSGHSIAGVEAGAPVARGPALGTAHGEREYSYAAHTSFLRRQSHPDEIVRIRYDSLENLIAMGIVRPHRSPGPHPNPFPGSDTQGYVPDPPP
jgi:hypothetical protein